MPRPPRSKFAIWLEGRYIEWMRHHGRRRTITEFADWLGVSKSVLANWLNGQRRPSPASVRRLAAKLGDEVYDALDIPRPDPELQTIIEGWGRLSAEQRHALHEQYASYAKEA